MFLTLHIMHGHDYNENDKYDDRSDDDFARCNHHPESRNTPGKFRHIKSKRGISKRVVTHLAKWHSAAKFTEMYSLQNGLLGVFWLIM